MPAKPAEGKHKTKLAINRRRRPVVKKIYSWRVIGPLPTELNLDLYRYPPPAG